MSSDETPNVPAARNSREAVREKAQRVHAQQSRARIMRRVIIGLVAAVAVGSIGTAVAFAVSSSMSKPMLSPSGMTDDGVTVSDVTLASGSADISPNASPTPSEAAAKPTPKTTEKAAEPTQIHIYVDYLSAGAAEFEKANARQLAGWIKQGAVTVTYHPVALLMALSGIGGLGAWFTAGYQTNKSDQIIAGIIVVLALAAVMDLLIVLAGWLLTPWERAATGGPGRQGLLVSPIVGGAR